MLLDDATPLDLEAARNWFAARVIGQDEAVDLVVDLLATVKAGLARPGKPIASLMFIGPTGVGKTELAKALAEFLFGDSRRMTRFDMSEYADPIAVLRLIGGATGRGEGLLTARVREQPFSVLLLDEFEKADPSFFDLLLQVLGEGRLTDVAGSLADFRNAVVIMTSNLGAESYRRGRSGFVRGRATAHDSRAHFVREVQAMVRPELFNRLDRIVPFAPLDLATAGGIVDRQLGLIARRDGFRSGLVRLSVAPGVPRRLARRGHDPTYGARPLKRAIERELLAPLAERINRHASDAALDVDVTLDAADRPRVAVRARLDDRGRQLFATSEEEAALFARSCQDLRRRTQRLRRSAVTLEVFNEITRHRQGQERRARKGKPPTFRILGPAGRTDPRRRVNRSPGPQSRGDRGRGHAPTVRSGRRRPGRLACAARGGRAGLVQNAGGAAPAPVSEPGSGDACPLRRAARFPLRTGCGLSRSRHPRAADGSSSGSSSTRRTTVRRKSVGSSSRANSRRTRAAGSSASGWSSVGTTRRPGSRPSPDCTGSTITAASTRASSNRPSWP